MQGVFESQLAAGLLQVLHQGGGGEVADAHALLDQAMADDDGEVGLADAAYTEQEDVAGLTGPVGGRDQCLCLTGIQSRYRAEVEGGEGLPTGS